MEYRALGRTGLNISAVSFGAWAIGGAWGAVEDDESLRALHAAVDAGVNFIDIRENLTAWVDRSLSHLDTDAIDPLDAQTMAAVRRVYDERIRASVHGSW